MSAKADPDVKKAIEAHRQQTILANQQIAILNAQLEALNVKQRRSEIIEQELKTLPADAVTYRAIGRMFIKKNLPVIIEDIVHDRDLVNTSIETLKKNKEVISNGLNASKDSLLELLNSKQAA
ncbi:unnamed protein product [Calicophoron daubneyi]|uniref:Prefoldin subunit 1 n=1 Tax=Calicophoron daubneyi TaxID=300641 RepID=A0AAV2TWA1_CALDB